MPKFHIAPRYREAVRACTGDSDDMLLSGPRNIYGQLAVQDGRALHGRDLMRHNATAVGGCGSLGCHEACSR